MTNKLGWVEHEARIGEITNSYKIVVWKLNEQDRSKDVQVDV